MATNKTPVQLSDHEVELLADVMSSIKTFALDAPLRVDDITFVVSSDDGAQNITRLGTISTTVGRADVDVQFHPAVS